MYYNELARAGITDYFQSPNSNILWEQFLLERPKKIRNPFYHIARETYEVPREETAHDLFIRDSIGAGRVEE